jgi:hypothetical protein
VFQGPTRENSYDRKPQFHPRAVKRTRIPEIVDLLAVAADDRALASFHDCQEGDLIGRPIKKYPTPASALGA